MNATVPNYIDAHSHIADPRLDSVDEAVRRSWLGAARKMGIALHLQGGVGPEDWERQLTLGKLFPEILPVFGLHPYWVADHSDAECEEALDQLAKSLSPCLAIGEMGLDLRPHIAGQSHDRQIGCFEAQLQLANAIGKPIVLHVVRAFDEVLRIFDMWGVPGRGGFVHSFNGSIKEANEYLRLGLLLSVGGPVARNDNQRLHQAVKEIPLEQLLLETDSPDQPGDQYQNQLNPPESLFLVAKAVASIKGLPPEEILDITSRNLRKLLQL
jgi:TatD DNase family protein